MPSLESPVPEQHALSLAELPLVPSQTSLVANVLQQASPGKRSSIKLPSQAQHRLARKSTFSPLQSLAPLPQLQVTETVLRKESPPSVCISVEPTTESPPSVHSNVEAESPPSISNVEAESPLSISNVEHPNDEALTQPKEEYCEPTMSEDDQIQVNHHKQVLRNICDY